MPTKTVLIVEDHAQQRIALQERLRSRGFHAEGAGTVAEAYSVIERFGEEIEVMVLDMVLDDPNRPGITGADIGIHVRDSHPEWMTESIISTVHYEEVDYYRLAIRLGAAAYLSKYETKVVDVVRHVRALALRRSLRLRRPKMVETLKFISLSTPSPADAMEKFCRNVLAAEFDTCLGASYFLLLTDDRGTQCVVNNCNLSNGFAKLFEAVQSMAQGKTNRSLPHKISPSELVNLPTALSAPESTILARLPEAVLVSLADVSKFRLSLALLEPLPGEHEYPEDTTQLASVVAQYVRPIVVEDVLSILIHLDSQKTAILKSLSYLCLSVGQEQQKLIDVAISRDDMKHESDGYRKMTLMANDLWETGTMLNDAANSYPPEKSSRIDIREVVERVFAELSRLMWLDELDFELEGSCHVSGRTYDIEIVMKRLLQWLAQRKTETPDDLRPGIKVRCFEQDNNSFVVFQDRSRRLPQHLRECMFEPFATSVAAPGDTQVPGPGLYLPLYLAKALVEGKYGGQLDDKSDEAQSRTGHSFVVCLPRAPDPKTPDFLEGSG
jgi:DNA-binding NarL/FixJ family response regulator